MIGSIDRMVEQMNFTPLSQFPMFKAGAPFFFDWLEHPGYDDYWRRLSIQEHHAKINVPALNIGGWHDIFQGGTIRNYLGMKSRGAGEAARAGQRLMMGPWNHSVPFTNLVGDIDYGYRSSPISADVDGAQLDFSTTRSRANQTAPTRTARPESM